MKFILSVTLDKADALFRGGDVIIGHLQFCALQEVRVKAVKLYIRGSSRVSWRETGKVYFKGANLSADRNASEVFLDHCVTLMKCNVSDVPKCQSGCFSILSKEIEEGQLMAAGKYAYPFKFMLPKSLPSSYHGKWGQIQYWLKGVVERSLAVNLEKQLDFSVHRLVDLNDDPEARRQVNVGQGFPMAKLCCSRGYVNTELSLPQAGYVCGGSIPVCVEVDNRSTKKLYMCKVVLTQNVLFRADDVVKRWTQVLSSSTLTQGEMLPGETKRWDNELLAVPHVPPSSGPGKKPISFRYNVSILVSPSSWANDFEVTADVLIGTVPFKKSSGMKNFGIKGSRESTPRGSLATLLPENSRPNLVHDGITSCSKESQVAGSHTPRQPSPIQEYPNCTPKKRASISNNTKENENISTRDESTQMSINEDSISSTSKEKQAKMTVTSAMKEQRLQKLGNEEGLRSKPRKSSLPLAQLDLPVRTEKRRSLQIEPGILALKKKL